MTDGSRPSSTALFGAARIRDWRSPAARDGRYQRARSRGRNRPEALAERIATEPQVCQSARKIIASEFTALTMAAWPTTAMRSRCPRALTLARHTAHLAMSS